MATKKTSKAANTKKLRKPKKLQATKPLTGGTGAGKVTFNPF